MPTIQTISQQIKTVFSVIFLVLSLTASCQTLKQDSIMPILAIRYVPEVFNNLQFGYCSEGHNICSPLYPDEATRYLRNELLINVPEKIIYSASLPMDSIQPVIPVCVALVVSGRRGYKYAHLSDEILYIRKIDSDDSYSGIIYEKPSNNLEISHPDQKVWQNELEKRIAEAQQYSDDELNKGSFSGEYRNMNLMQYVDIPLEPGIYEIYYSVLGLESNRVQVEIVFE